MTRWTATLLYTILILGTIGSVAANLAHARPETGPRILAAAPPIGVLLVTELGAAWSRSRLRSKATYRVILGGVILVAACAAVLSFTAVRDLAVSYGNPSSTAFMWPVILDGALCLAAVGLTVGRESPVPHAEAPPVPEGGPTVPADDAPEPETADQAHASGEFPVIQPESPSLTEGLHGDRSGAHAEAARIKAELRTALTEAQVSSILDALDAGESQRAAAEAAGTSQKTVQRITTARAAVREGVLA